MHHKHNYNCYYPTEVLKDFEFQLVHVQIIFSSLKWAHHYFHPHLQAFFLLLHWEHYLELVQNLKDFIFFDFVSFTRSEERRVGKECVP